MSINNPFGGFETGTMPNKSEYDTNGNINIQNNQQSTQNLDQNNDPNNFQQNGHQNLDQTNTQKSFPSTHHYQPGHPDPSFTPLEPRPLQFLESVVFPPPNHYNIEQNENPQNHNFQEQKIPPGQSEQFGHNNNYQSTNNAIQFTQPVQNTRNNSNLPYQYDGGKKHSRKFKF